MNKATEVITSIIGGLVLYACICAWVADFDPESFGLGQNTRPFTSNINGTQVSGYSQHIPQIKSTINQLKAHNFKVLLWVGNSQLHSIIHPKPGDQLAVVFANQAAEDHKTQFRFVQVTEPNANFHELWSIVQHFLAEETVDGIILGFSYSGLREVEVRSALMKYYQEAPIDQEFVNRVDASSNNDIVPTEGTPQGNLESFLVDLLEQLFPSFKQRTFIRSYLNANFETAVIRLKFALFDKPQEKIAPSSATWNEKALDAIVNLTHEKKIPLLVYQVPHRPGLKKFTHPRDEYDQYHTELQQKLAAYPNVFFIDLEKIVPEKYWGVNAANFPDAFHFQGEGHRILGESIEGSIENWKPSWK